MVRCVPLPGGNPAHQVARVVWDELTQLACAKRATVPPEVPRGRENAGRGTQTADTAGPSKGGSATSGDIVGENSIGPIEVMVSPVTQPTSVSGGRFRD